MNAEELKNIVSLRVTSPRALQVFLVLKTDSGFVMRLADIEDKTEPEIQDLFEDYLKTAIISNDDLTIRSLSLADETPNTIYEYDYESYPEELDLFASFGFKEIVTANKFDFRKDNLNDLFGYIVYDGSMDNGIIMFKIHYPISLIKRDSFLLGAHKAKQRFEKLPGNDIVRLNGTVQLLRIGDKTLVLDLHVLEKMLGFSELVKKDAVESVNAIESLNLIENIETLKELTEDPSFARKLSKVKKTSPIFKLGIGKETIIAFSKSTPGLSKQFKYNDDGTKIRLDTKKSKTLFLKLMNDAFLRSELTKQYYEAIAKDAVSE